MSIFKSITLSFAGKNYLIPANNVMPCLAQIEDVVTLQDISNKNRVPIVKVSQAYGIALRYAGAEVTDEQIYESIFENGGAATISAAVSGLLAMMIPPTKFQESVAVSTTEAKKPRKTRRN